MSPELYFIRILADASSRPDRLSAYLEAFAKILRLGNHAAYQVGLQQFYSFVAAASGQSLPTIYLDKEGIILAQILPCQAVDEFRIPGILPGNYSVYLETGRLLWAGELKAEDLLWTYCFPATALPLAAETQKIQNTRTREQKLLQGEIVVRLYPGLESGTLGILIKHGKPRRK